MHRTLPSSASAGARATASATHPALARSTPGDLADAHQRARDLLRAAEQLAVASRHDPDTASCVDAGCHLPGLGDDGRLCVLVHELGLLVPDPAPVVTVHEAYDAFVTACRHAIDAIRVCRQTAHPSGVCWFSANAEGDGCRAVLRLTHRLG